METQDITKFRIADYLAEGKRFDGRKPGEFRDLTIEYGVSCKAEGSAKVKLGKTEVIVGVKLGLGEPYPDSANKGNLMTTAEILPLSSPRVEIGRPGFNSIEMGRVIDRGLRESGFIDFEKLCIEEGKKVWTIFVDIYTINDDGNLLDAAGIGAIAALRDAYMPKYDAENDRVLYGEDSGKKLPLTEINPITISVHKVGKNFLVDPTREEEDASKTRLTVGSSNGIISSMQKSNEDCLSTEEFAKCLDLLDETMKVLDKELSKNLH